MANAGVRPSRGGGSAWIAVPEDAAGRHPHRRAVAQAHRAEQTGLRGMHAALEVIDGVSFALPAAFELILLQQVFSPDGLDMLGIGFALAAQKRPGAQNHVFRVVGSTAMLIGKILERSEPLNNLLSTVSLGWHPKGVAGGQPQQRPPSFLFQKIHHQSPIFSHVHFQYYHKM